MHSLTVFEQDDTQSTVLHFGNTRPAPYPPIGLTFFSQGMLDGAHDPLLLDDGTIWAATRVEEVAG